MSNWIVKKLEFDSEQQATSTLKSLGIIQETEDGDLIDLSKHSVVTLGNIVLHDAVLDSNGEVVTPAVLSTKWHVDVMSSEDIEFGSFDVTESASINPIHSFG